MNKSILFFLLLLLISCQKETVLEPVNRINESADNSLSIQGDQSKNAKQDKVTICHRRGNGSYSAISVNANALSAHLNHGDYLPDADGDGFTAVNACTGSADDCDDSDPTVYPGATEVCGDGIDNNCDGQVDEDCCPCFTYEYALAVATASPSVFFADEEIYDCFPIEINTFFFDPTAPRIIGTLADNDLLVCYEETATGNDPEIVNQEVFDRCTAILRQVQSEVQANLFCTDPALFNWVPPLDTRKELSISINDLLQEINKK